MHHSRLPPDEFSELLRPHLPALYRLAFRFTGRQFDAEDLLQELLTRLYSRSERLTTVEILRPWLARALYNLHVDQCRSRARTPFGHLQARGNDAEESIAARQDPGGGSESAAEALLMRQHLAAAVAELPEEQQLVVILHDVEGYELHEAAAILGVPLGTAKSRLHRARDRLRGYLQNRNLTPSNIVLRGEAPVPESANIHFGEAGDEI
jgi:RNA polymerase sigma factor (sigma-70 family)